MLEAIVYTDGSVKGNGQENAKGGWAYVILYGNDLTKNDNARPIQYRRSRAIEGTTNNRMELTAIIEAIEKIYNFKDYTHIKHIYIYTDSAYIYNCYAQKWYINWLNNNWKNSKKEEVRNKDLWIKLIPYFNNDLYSFHKVLGHSGDKYNEIVDYMAQDAAFGNEVNEIYFG